MITIAVCDDNPIELSLINDLLSDMNLAVEVRVLNFSSYNEFLTAVEKTTTEINVAILDIDLGEKNGIELASAAQKINPFMEIIFATGHSEYCQAVYDVEHMAFVVKPIDTFFFEKAVNKSIAKFMNQNFSSICLTSNNNKHFVKQADIVYLERQARKTCVTTVLLEKIITYDTIDDILQKINNCTFIRCHKSFAVNTMHIKSYMLDEFVMLHGIRVPISRKYRKEVSQSF